MHRRFQGKTILVSNITRRSTGYLGGSDYHPLRDEDVPRPFMLQEPGTALYIPTYKPEPSWGNESAATVIKHFFHAIVHGKLEATIDRQVVKSDTIGRFGNLMDGRTSNFVSVSQEAPVAKTRMQGIGDVSIRIKVYEDDPGKREIAIVRDAGMMITDEPRDMSLQGLRRLPRDWKGFTAIIECLSGGGESLLRDSESPEHNKISTDFISDTDRRKAANERLRELGQWCREQIEELCKPEISGEDNASEMAKYLPLDDDGSGNNGGDLRETKAVLLITPYQSIRPPRRIRIRRGKSQDSQGLGDGNERERSDGDKKQRTRNPRPRGTVSQPSVAPRFRPGRRNTTHSVIVTFDHAEPLHNVQLIAVGEDGQDVQVGISEAYVDEQRVPVDKDTIPFLDSGSSDRVRIEFITREPIPNKTYNIRGESEI